MRIAYVCVDPGVPVWGQKGCSVHVQEVIRAMLTAGHEVQLLCTRLGGSVPLDLSDVTVECLELPRGLDTAAREHSLQQVSRDMAQRIAEVEGVELVYERYSLFSCDAMEWAREHRVPSILEVNAPLIQEQAHYRELIDHVAAARSTERCSSAATVVAAVSSSVADYATRHGARPASVVVVPNGVSLERFDIQREPRGDRPFTIGFVGALRPWHAVGDLVAAFAKLELSNIELTIVGDGPQRDALAQQVASLDAATQARISLVGHVAPDEVPLWLSRFDVGVAPYAADGQCYFSPLKLYEYMAAGLPVVAANAGGLREVVLHGHNGLLYTPGDVAQLALCLRSLAASPLTAQRLGQRSRLDAERHHSWSSRVEYMLSLASAACPSQLTA